MKMRKPTASDVATMTAMANASCGSSRDQSGGQSVEGSVKFALSV